MEQTRPPDPLSTASKGRRVVAALLSLGLPDAGHAGRDETRDFIKRVIGTGGQDVFIQNRLVCISCRPPEPACQPIADPWAYHEDRLGRGTETFGPVHVPADSYFVIGDNRNNSENSRYGGFVRRDKIEGLAFLIWSWDSEPDGKPLWERVRWSRLGRLIS